VSAFLLGLMGNTSKKALEPADIPQGNQKQPDMTDTLNERTDLGVSFNEDAAKEDAKVQAFSTSSTGRRRSGVSAAPVSQERMEGWKGAPVYPKSDVEVDQIKATIQKSEALAVLFGHLSSTAIDAVVGAMFAREVQVGDIVIEQGADGDFFYIVDTGVYEIFVQRRADMPADKVMVATAVMIFGELALMYNAPRAATVKCAQPGKLWCLDRESFQMMLITASNSQAKEYEKLLSNVDVLKDLTCLEIANISDLLTSELFDSGEEIVKQGDEGDAAFFLLEGECKAYIAGDQGEKEVKHYTHQGEFFGEIALILNETRRATVRACADGCVALKLKREDLDLSIGCMRERMLENIEKYPQYQAFLTQ